MWLHPLNCRHFSLTVIGHRSKESIDTLYYGIKQTSYYFSKLKCKWKAYYNLVKYIFVTNLTVPKVDLTKYLLKSCIISRLTTPWRFLSLYMWTLIDVNFLQLSFRVYFLTTKFLLDLFLLLREVTSGPFCVSSISCPEGRIKSSLFFVTVCFIVLGLKDFKIY